MFFYALAYYSAVCWVTAILLYDDGIHHSIAEIVFAPLLYAYKPCEFICQFAHRKLIRWSDAGRFGVRRLRRSTR